MICGCIDIGSNTTRLLVAEPADGRLRELLRQRAFTRIGKGLLPDDTIPAKKIREVAEVVATQVRLARELGTRDDPRGRDGGDPRRRQPGGLHPRGRAARRRRGRGAQRRGGGAARVRRRDQRPRPSARRRHRGGRRRRRLLGDRDRHDRRRRARVELVPDRLGLPRRLLPARRPAHRRRSSSGCARTSPAPSRASRCRPRSWPSASAAARPRCGGWSAACSTTRRSSAGCGSSRPPPSEEVARAFELEAERVRAAARRHARARGDLRPARAAADDRPRRTARGRDPRAGRGAAQR